MKFNEKKTTQAASRFLTLAQGQMNYMMLIKLLYLIDREALMKIGNRYDQEYVGPPLPPKE